VIVPMKSEYMIALLAMEPVVTMRGKVVKSGS
jgi:hypothetical protein